MRVYPAQEASDLCGIPYASLMNYAEKWPWLVYRDKDREVNPNLAQGLPRAYVPRGTTAVLALIRTAFEAGLSAKRVDTILRAIISAEECFDTAPACICGFDFDTEQGFGYPPTEVLTDEHAFIQFPLSTPPDMTGGIDVSDVLWERIVTALRASVARWAE